MKTSNTRTRKFGLTIGKIVMVLAFVSMISGISIAPAFGKNNNRGQGYYNNQGRYYNNQGRYYNNQGRYGYGRRVYRQPPRHYYYSAPVYVPPPVVYDPYPYQSPGISLVFPLNFR